MSDWQTYTFGNGVGCNPAEMHKAASAEIHRLTDKNVSLTSILIDTLDFLEAWHFDVGPQGDEVQAQADQLVKAIRSAVPQCWPPPCEFED